MTSSDLPIREWWDEYDFPERLPNQNFAGLLDEDDVRRLACKSKFRKLISINNGLSEVNYTAKCLVISFTTAQFEVKDIKVSVDEDFIIVKAKHDAREDKDEPGHTISRELTRKYPLPKNSIPEKIEAYYFADKLVITAPMHLKPTTYEVPIKDLSSDEIREPSHLRDTRLAVQNFVLKVTSIAEQYEEDPKDDSELSESESVTKTLSEVPSAKSLSEESAKMADKIVPSASFEKDPKVSENKPVELEAEFAEDDTSDKSHISVSEDEASESEESVVDSSERKTVDHINKLIIEKNGTKRTVKVVDDSKEHEEIDNSSSDIKGESKTLKNSGKCQIDSSPTKQSEDKNMKIDEKFSSKETDTLKVVAEPEKTSEESASSDEDIKNSPKEKVCSKLDKESNEASKENVCSKSDEGKESLEKSVCLKSDEEADEEYVSSKSDEEIEKELTEESVCAKSDEETETGIPEENVTSKLDEEKELLKENVCSEPDEEIEKELPQENISSKSDEGKEVPEETVSSKSEEIEKPHKDNVSSKADEKTEKEPSKAKITLNADEETESEPPKETDSIEEYVDPKENLSLKSGDEKSDEAKENVLDKTESRKSSEKLSVDSPSKSPLRETSFNKEANEKAEAKGDLAAAKEARRVDQKKVLDKPPTIKIEDKASEMKSKTTAAESKESRSDVGSKPNTRGRKSIAAKIVKGRK